MKYIVAYMLAKLGGKENPNIDDIRTIIESVGIEFDNKKAEEITRKLNGRNLNDIINDGESKLAFTSIPQTEQNSKEQTSSQQKENEHQEEEEALDISGGFDDLFE